MTSTSNSEHYNDVIMSVMASQITSVSIVYLSVCSGADQRKHQSSASLAFVRGIHRCPVNSSHKGPVTRKTSTFEDVIMNCLQFIYIYTVAEVIMKPPSLKNVFFQFRHLIHFPSPGYQQPWYWPGLTWLFSHSASIGFKINIYDL